MKARRFKLIPPGASREVASLVADTKGRLRRGDVRAIAIVLVRPGGEVDTCFAGHHDGHFHQLNSGISILRKRFDEEAT